MQCVNCHFENLPGSSLCGRCGTAMQIGAMAIDVHPPRASARRKLLRRIFPVRRAAGEVSDAAGTVAGPSVVELLRGNRRFLGIFLRFPVAGWPHFYLGQRSRGRVLFWLWIALLVPGILLSGSTLGAILVGFAFSIHVAGIGDIFNQLNPEASIRRQLLRSIVIGVIVACCLYVPAAHLLFLVAEPRAIQLNLPPLRVGDVYLVNSLSYWRSPPRPGDVVMYDVGPRVWRTQTANGGRREVQFEGDRIDRVLASAGDVVVWKNGVLRVNGRPSYLLPLNPRQAPPLLKLRVPEGHCLILPTTTPNLEPSDEAGLWESLSLVHHERIRGRVYYRTLPPWRPGWL